MENRLTSVTKNVPLPAVDPIVCGGYNCCAHDPSDPSENTPEEVFQFRPKHQ